MASAATFDWFQQARSEDFASRLKMIQRLREGISFQELDLLLKLFNLTQSEVASALRISARTFARRKKDLAGRLAADEGERVARLARVLAKASDTLGSIEKARTWIKRENRALSGATPISLMDTDLGAQAVLDILGRIEHGVHS